MESRRSDKLAFTQTRQTVHRNPWGRAVHILRRGASGLTIIPLAVWVLLFVGIPAAFMLTFSFLTYSEYAVGLPWTSDNYTSIIRAAAYGKLFLKTLMVGSIVTVITLVVASPYAYYLARIASKRIGIFLLLLTVLPLWTNEVIRNYAWYPVAAKNGVIDTVLSGIGLPDLGIMFTMELVIVVAVFLALPFAVLVLYATMLNISPELEETALDLGSGPFHTFRKVILPLSASGYQVATLLVFIPTLALYLTPLMLGGTEGTMVATILRSLVLDVLDFAQGSAFLVPVIAILLIVVLALRRGVNIDSLYKSGVGSSIARHPPRSSPKLLAYVVMILFLTYMPFMSMIMFSFGQNPLAVFPMMGLTLRWYSGLLSETGLVAAVGTSAVLAAEAALIAIVVSAPAAYAIVRYRFPGRGVFLFVSLLPMLIPPFILALGIFILLATLGIGFSLQSMVIGHVTLVLPFVFLTILAHQYGFDRTLEEASQDLGASPVLTFIRVVLPLMLPAFLAAAFLAFAVSFNDFVIALILSGDDAVTLPMYILEYRKLRLGTQPTMNAVGTLLTLGAALVLLFILLRPWRIVFRGIDRASLKLKQKSAI